MWTQEDLEEIDRAVRARYKGSRVLTQEKTGLTVDEPPPGEGQEANVRRLTYELCAMSYTSPQYNVILLGDEINRRAKKCLVTKATYSASRRKIYFYLGTGRRIDFDTSEPISGEEFLSRFHTDSEN